MTSRSQMLGISAGVVAGMILGSAAGIAAKSMTEPRSPVKKKVSSAFESVSEIFGHLAKFTG